MHSHLSAGRPTTLHIAPRNHKRKISVHMFNRNPCESSSMFHLIYLLTCVTTFTIAQNDVQPQQNQHNNILSFTVGENRPNGTLIGNIRSSDGQVPYFIMPMSHTTTTDALLKAAFNVNFLTGDLTTNSVLDREQQERYDFIAVVSQPFGEIKCSVTVSDANDQAPMFLLEANKTEVEINLPEGVKGARSRLPVAVDYDVPDNGIKEFRIISGNTPSGTFHLIEHDTIKTSTSNSQNGNPEEMADDAASNLPGAENPQLLQQLKAQALIPSQSSVGVTNQQQISSHSTSRTSALGSSMDPRVRYYNIDLEASQPLDRENQSSYQLVIEAIDGGQPPLFGRLSVTVNVLDRNDNDPEFRSKLYECRIKEDAPRRSLVMRLHAYDPDLDSNGQVSYYIKRHLQSNSTDFNVLPNGGYGKQRNQQSPSVITTNAKPSPFSTKLRSGNNAEQLFEIDPIKGEIYLAEQLDYESEQYHELVIEARDHGKPYRSSYATVKVYVEDVPDEAPSVARPVEDRSGSASDTRAESPAQSPQVIEPIPSISSIIGNINLAQISHPTLFVMIFGALVAVGSFTCFIKIKSSQPDSDYNPDADTAILASNNVQSKPSPNHSSSNLEQSNVLMGDSLNRHHAIARPMGSHTAQGRHHPMNHRHYMYDNQNHYTPSSLTYGASHNHSRAALLQHAHHHQSSHQLSSAHHMLNGLSKCGTMNSVGTHHSAHPPFGSTMPATPNTVHSSGLPSNMHDNFHHSHHNPLLPTVPQSHQVCQLPPTPSHNVPQGSVFAWPTPQAHDSGSGCCPGPNGTLQETPGSTNDSCSSRAGQTTPQPLDRWFDLGGAPQLVNSEDWCGSYNWDYLEDWTPQYHLLSIP